MKVHHCTKTVIKPKFHKTWKRLEVYEMGTSGKETPQNGYIEGNTVYIYYFILNSILSCKKKKNDTQMTF
jgi:hypothetical protein